MPSLASSQHVTESKEGRPVDHNNNTNSNSKSHDNLARHGNNNSDNNTNDLMVPGLGSLVTLLSTKQIRYEGALFSANLEQNKITLANVRCFGTEDRACARPVRPSDAVYEYVVFSAGAIVRMEITQGCPVLLPRSAPMRRDPAVCLVTTFGRKWNSDEVSEAPGDGAATSTSTSTAATTTTASTTTSSKGPGSRRLRFFPRRHSTGAYGGPRTFASQLTAVPEEGSAQMLVAASLEDYPEVETARYGASPPPPLAGSPEGELVMGSPAASHEDYAAADVDSTPGDVRGKRTRRRHARQRSRTAPGDEERHEDSPREDKVEVIRRRRDYQRRGVAAATAVDSGAGDEDSTPVEESAAGRRRPRRRRRRRNTAPSLAESHGVHRSWSLDSGFSLFSLLEGLLSPTPASSRVAPAVEFQLASRKLQEIQREIKDVSDVLTGCSALQDSDPCPDDGPAAEV